MKLESLSVVILLLAAAACQGQQTVLSFTSKWCGPCQQMKPIVAQLKHEGCRIREVDVDREPQLAQRYGVPALPYFIAVSESGAKIGEILGATSATNLRALASTQEIQPEPGGRPGSHNTRNFSVTAPTPALAKEIGVAAEYWRKEMAKLWLGKELPPWSSRCSVNVKVLHRGSGSGGSTTFTFNEGEVYGWKMEVQGSRERILDSVLPHEISHTVFASHFREPLPRWADEGACTTVEPRAEQAKHERFLIECLKTGRGIAFDRMLATTEYPADILPFYAQGHSVAQWLIERYGRRKFVGFLENGLTDKDWQRAIRDEYGFNTPHDMQNQWLAWVKSGRPAVQVASAKIEIDPSPHCRVRTGRGTTDTASATLVHKDSTHGIVATCYHEVRDLPPPYAVLFADGSEYPAKLVDYNVEADVAVLTISPPAANPVTVASDVSGNQFYAVGYPGESKQLRVIQGQIHPSSRALTQPGQYAMYGHSHQGESGGAVLNERGEMVGIRHSTDGERSLFTGGGVLSRILDRVAPGRPAKIIGRANYVSRSNGSVGGGYGYGPQPPTTFEPQPPLVPVEPEQLTGNGLEYLFAQFEQRINARLDAIEGTPGPAGPQGPPGKPGPPGPPGEDADAGELTGLTIDELADQVIRRLPPVKMELTRLDGTVRRQEKPLGEPIRMKLTNQALEID